MPAPCAHICGLLNGITLPGVVPFRTRLHGAVGSRSARSSSSRRERVTFMVGPPTFFRGLMDARRASTRRGSRRLRLISSGGAGVSDRVRRGGRSEARRAGEAHVRLDRGADGASPTDAPIAAAELQRRGRRRAARARPRGVRRLPRSRRQRRTRSPPTAGSAPATSRRSTPTGSRSSVALKDVIIRGGENISTAEVEAVLEAHPAVRQAVAVGYPDALMGERVAAFVVSRRRVRRRRGAGVVRRARRREVQDARTRSSSSHRCRCSRPASPTAPRYAVRSSQGEVSTPIILKPLMTALGFNVPGFQW